MKKLLFISSILLASFSFKSSEEAELFKGERLLATCKIDIPLTYKSADDAIVAEVAKKYAGKELILLTLNKKTKKVYFQRYYLVSETTKGQVFNYLMTKEEYLSGANTATFIKYSKKLNRFYESSCFDEVLKSNTDLSENLIETK